MASHLISLVTASLLVLSLGDAALAQAPAPTPSPKQDTPAPPVQQHCTPQSTNPLKPETRGQGAGTELGEQLSKSNGVICPPPGVDPEIATPPPGGGNMPVIPPPGTPGGNQDVVPK
jgi:hypothetical protein